MTIVPTALTNANSSHIYTNSYAACFAVCPISICMLVYMQPHIYVCMHSRFYQNQPLWRLTNLSGFCVAVKCHSNGAISIWFAHFTSTFYNKKNHFLVNLLVCPLFASNWCGCCKSVWVCLILKIIICEKILKIDKEIRFDIFF